MTPMTALSKITATAPHLLPVGFDTVETHPLTREHEAEVLAFLSARPVHTVFMAGLIRDNGIESPLNRGSFYGCRNLRGELEGVALIGHATLVETRTDAALEAFARLAQKCTSTHMIMGEQERIEEFWNHYVGDGQEMRLACREILFELRRPSAGAQPMPGLRRATLEDLELILPVHAQLAFEESGVNPLEKDPEGFRRRCARRIEQGRVWVLVEGGRLIFKADIISETPEVIYLEGIYVDPAERGRGYGSRCVSQLARNLLRRAGSICLLVNEQNERAHAFYRRAGFTTESCYDTIFLRRKGE